jgi:hypothetical protein
MPTVNSSESPGRNNPMSTPHSAKMIAAPPHSAQSPREFKRCSGSIHEGRSAGIVARCVKVASIPAA